MNPILELDLRTPPTAVGQTCRSASHLPATNANILVPAPTKASPSSLLWKFGRRGSAALPSIDQNTAGVRTLIDELLDDQHELTAVERFSQLHNRDGFNRGEKVYRGLLPARPPNKGEQYAFEVDLDQCSGCKACVSACHSLNGLEEGETWRGVGLLVSKSEARSPRSEGNSSLEFRIADFGFQQHITTACHHCVDPACLNGCPVLAYDKDPATGIVRHLDDQCMGCSYCVMKCPYEVPKYSSRLGIVRKCDLCAGRLGTGEAPACVQGCPNEAIRITVVKQAAVVERHADRKLEVRNSRLEGNPKSEIRESSFEFRNSFGCRVSDFEFPPDSPNPAITLPTTRYVSKRGLPVRLVAADHGAPRLDPPHWPLAWMLVLTQSAAGMFLAGAVMKLSGPAPDARTLNLAAFSLLCGGLAASVLHLGRPLKAWRAFLGWRRSWLSREIIALNVFAGMAALAVAVELFPPLQVVLRSDACIIVASLAGLIGVFASAMVYVDTQRPFWSPRLAFGGFFGTTLLLGSTLAAVAFARDDSPAAAAPGAALAALVFRTALFAWRRREWRTALRDVDSPIHFNARVISELLPWTTPAGMWLFAVSTGCGLLAIANWQQAAPWWAGFAALATFSSEIIGRYVFFVAGGAKRMPGGIVS